MLGDRLAFCPVEGEISDLELIQEEALFNFTVEVSADAAASNTQLAAERQRDDGSSDEMHPFFFY